MQSFFDQTRRDLLPWVERPTRAVRVFRSVYRDRIANFDGIRSVPAATLAALNQSFSLQLPVILQRFDSEDGTRRYLLRLSDNETVESVLIPSADRATFCISSQIGCGLACAFCLTGQLGLTRDLSVGEIVSQVVLLQRETAHRRISVVLMGMGEPLQNYDNVVKALHVLHDDNGLGVPLSRITVSTAGLVPAIERLAQERYFPNLSISLTGVTNTVRDVMMPINRKYPIERVIDSVRRLPAARQSRVMFEVVLIKDITDSSDQANELSRLLGGTQAKVNLIPLNPAPEIPFQRSDERAILRFQEILLARGTTAFIRRNRGNDVSGACGQLKKKLLA